MRKLHYVLMRLVGPFVEIADRYRAWKKDRIVSRLLAQRLEIPVELAYALGQDNTGEAYLEAKRKLIAKGRVWKERPIRIGRTLDDLRREQEEKRNKYEESYS